MSYAECHDAECHNAECRMPSVIDAECRMLSVIMLGAAIKIFIPSVKDSRLC